MSGMKDGDYIVSINEQEVKWSPHDEVVSLIKRSGNALKLRLVTPLDKKESQHKISHTESALKVRGLSSSPTSSASSTSGHSSGGVSGNLQSFSQPSGGELSSSPASSITSGSTRSHKNSENLKKSVTQPWNPFKKGPSPNNKAYLQINENIILR